VTGFVSREASGFLLYLKKGPALEAGSNNKIVFSWEWNGILSLREGGEREAQRAAAKLARASGILARAGLSPSMANTPEQPDPAN
jgi:hypothetical protein